MIPYSPTAGGLLTGKYGKGQKPEEGSRHLTNTMYQQRYSDDWMLDAAGRVTEFAQQHGWHPVSLAVAWVAANAAVTSVILGAASPEHICANVKGLERPIDPALKARLDELSAVPTP